MIGKYTVRPMDSMGNLFSEPPRLRRLCKASTAPLMAGDTQLRVLDNSRVSLGWFCWPPTASGGPWNVALSGFFFLVNRIYGGIFTPSDLVLQDSKTFLRVYFF